MATKALLVDLAQAYHVKTGVKVEVESVGGVDAVKRVQAGEMLDVVLLGSDAIDRLMASGHVVTHSRCDWVRSPIAVAIRAGEAKPDIQSESGLKTAVLASPSLSYSTGPSGVYLEKLFERWGIAEQIKSRIVVPPPGTPVGALVAQGNAALGFQQLSELISLPGIDVLGTLPEEVAYITIFSAGVCAAIAHDLQRMNAVHSFIQFLASSEVEPLKLKQGMNWL